MDQHPEEQIPEHPSKSRIKREMHQVQALGERLLDLRKEQLHKVPLGNSMQAALEEMRRIKGQGARRRHLQYIGRLMRREDAEAIAAALQRLEAGSIQQKQHMHELDHWRDRLIEDGDGAAESFLATHPGADRQHIRQLIRTARKERDLGRPPAASRKLFRYLRGVIESE